MEFWIQIQLKSLNVIQFNFEWYNLLKKKLQKNNKKISIKFERKTHKNYEIWNK